MYASLTTLPPTWISIKTKMRAFTPTRTRMQPIYRALFFAFVLVQAALILVSSLAQRPWSFWKRGATAVDAYGALTGTVAMYTFFAPAVHPQWYVQVHAEGRPAYDEVLGSGMLSEEGALKTASIEDSFVRFSNIPLLLEFVSRQFFERHPEYKTVTITFGYYRIPPPTSWKRGERTSMTKSMEMTFQRFN